MHHKNLARGDNAERLLSSHLLKSLYMVLSSNKKIEKLRSIQ